MLYLTKDLLDMKDKNPCLNKYQIKFMVMNIKMRIILDNQFNLAQI
jgi:hypothetical protein